MFLLYMCVIAEKETRTFNTHTHTQVCAVHIKEIHHKLRTRARARKEILESTYVALVVWLLQHIFFF